MNTYKFKDLYVGMRESFVHTITQEDMKNFLSITGDINPLHKDSVFAQRHNFKEEVVYGLLSASLISTLGGVYLPGMYCLIQAVEIKYIFPVYVEDTLVIEGIVKELHESVQQAVIKIEIRNQYGNKVIRGSLKVGFLE